MTTRVYVPGTVSTLRRLAERGSLGSPPLFACAVTPDLRTWFARAGEDELDHEAQTAAAQESLRLLAADPDEVRRRVVLAVDVDDRAVTPDPAAGRTSVRVDAEVPLDLVVSIYVDGDTDLALVTAAVAAVDAADRGDHEAQRQVRAAGDAELLWYGTQELADLIG